MTAKNVGQYIDSFTEPVKERLLTFRKLIRELAPEAEESISYGMPAYKLFGKPLVYFAGYTRHTGFYATPSGHEAFASELAAYQHGKGSVQFPNSLPLPLDLIRRIIEFRIEENRLRVQKPNLQ